MLLSKRGQLLLGMICVLLAVPAFAQDDAAYDDYDDDYFAEDDVGGVSDPWERMNRGIFRFNEGADRWVIEPIAKGWDFVVPDFAQRAIRNAFDNAAMPIDFGNNLLQLKPQHAGRDIARFLLNSTVGIGGLMDPASTIGLVDSREDFGQTLGYWGVPTGPFLMLPLLGPSNIRDGAGLAVDSASNPASYFIPFAASASWTVGRLLNGRSLAIEQIAAERRAAVDFYAALRSGYSQYREGLVNDRGNVDAGSYGAFTGTAESDSDGDSQ